MSRQFKTTDLKEIRALGIKDPVTLQKQLYRDFLFSDSSPIVVDASDFKEDLGSLVDLAYTANPHSNIIADLGNINEREHLKYTLVPDISAFIVDYEFKDRRKTTKQLQAIALRVPEQNNASIIIRLKNGRHALQSEFQDSMSNPRFGGLIVNDQPGLQAALQIKQRYSHLQIYTENSELAKKQDVDAFIGSYSNPEGLSLQQSVHNIENRINSQRDLSKVTPEGILDIPDNVRRIRKYRASDNSLGTYSAQLIDEAIGFLSEYLKHASGNKSSILFKKLTDKPNELFDLLLNLGQDEKIESDKLSVHEHPILSDRINYRAKNYETLNYALTHSEEVKPFLKLFLHNFADSYFNNRPYQMSKSEREAFSSFLEDISSAGRHITPAPKTSQPKYQPQELKERKIA